MVLGNPTTHNTYSHSYSLLLVSYVHDHGIFPLKKVLSITSAGELSQQLQLGISRVLAGLHTLVLQVFVPAIRAPQAAEICSKHGEEIHTHTQGHKEHYQSIRTKQHM